MVAPVAGGGLGFTPRRAATIHGLYTMAVYTSSIPGGWFADRVIGHYRSDAGVPWRHRFFGLPFAYGFLNLSKGVLFSYGFLRSNGFAAFS
jgi:hypothetical protein